MALMTTLASGGCTNELPILAGFGLVRFRATFKSLDETRVDLNPNVWTDRKAHKSDFRAKLEVEGNDPPSDHVVLRIYTANDAIENWRRISADEQITFTANVNCVARTAFPGPGISFLVTLHDARPLLDSGK